jgi:hypothetical protein
MFESALLKLQRANHHITNLERQFDAFVAEKPHRISIQNHPETGELSVRVRFLKQLPRELALITGDAVHNLRVALDHLTWELVGIDHGTQDRYLKFPFGDTRVNFEASCKGIKTPSQWVKNFFISTEAFDGGAGYALYHIKLLNDADKHTVIVPVVRATTHPAINIINPDGSVMGRMEGNVFVGGAGEYIPLLMMGRGMSVELEDDANCAPQIFLKDPPVTVIPSLKHWFGEVGRTIEAAKNAVQKNLA